jgi:fimbrial chaperone protein
MPKVGIFLALALLTSGVCRAGAFSVIPVRLYFEPRDRAVAVTIVNEGDTEIALQADINSWTQDRNGADRLEQTEDLLVSPPILKLAPRARQVIRVALLAPRDATRQMTYRLVVREVPEAVRQNDLNLQLPIALVLSMPVFITPPVAKRDVQCSLGRSASLALQVECENRGTAYAQFREIELKRGESTLATFEGAMYILPWSKKVLALKAIEGAVPTPGGAELLIRYDDLKPQTFSVAIP